VNCCSTVYPPKRLERLERFERWEQLELVQDVQAVQIVQFKPNGQVENGWLVLQSVALRYVEKNRSHDHRAEGDNQAEGSEFPDVAIVPQLPNRHGHDLRARRIEKQG